MVFHLYNTFLRSQLRNVIVIREKFVMQALSQGSFVLYLHNYLHDLKQNMEKFERYKCYEHCNIYNYIKKK